MNLTESQVQTVLACSGFDLTNGETERDTEPAPPPAECHCYFPTDIAPPPGKSWTHNPACALAGAK